MNHKIENPQKLLDSNGVLNEPGWANKLIMEYSPDDVKANKIRIKEWDYYIITDSDGYAFSTTVCDNRYMGFINSAFYDFGTAKKTACFSPFLFPMGRLNMPTDSSKGDINITKNSCSLSITHEKHGRRIVGYYKKNLFHSDLSFDIFLHNYYGDTTVIASPWKEDKTAFYYNQKINCIPAEGVVKYNGKIHTFFPEKDFATLDWGRGVWTYDNTWYWSSGNGIIDGKYFGFNLGYGFGDTSAASENMIIYDGKSHKLDRIVFNIPDDIMAPWHFISSDGRFDMVFIPVYDNLHSFSIGVLGQKGHQVFGKVYGKAILNDGKTLEVNGLTAFAEKLRNRF